MSENSTFDETHIWEWTAEVDSTPVAITIGKDGSIYVAGSQSTDRSSTAFIKKYDIYGNQQWSGGVSSFSSWSSYSFASANALTTGIDGSIYITGRARRDENEVFIGKYGVDGVREWIKYFGTPNTDVNEWGLALTG